MTKTPAVFLLVLVLGGAGPSRAELPCESADLSDQFPDPGNRDQEATSSCHVFGSVALLEAAVWREFGERVVLSEADLFVQRKILTPDYLQMALAAYEDERPVFFLEGGYPRENLQYAIEHGVATQDVISWGDFYERYHVFEKARRLTIEADREAFQQMPAVDRYFYYWFVGDPGKRFGDSLQEDTAREIGEGMLLGGRDDVKKSRKRTRTKWLGQFVTKFEDFPFLKDEWDDMTEEECREKGQDAKEAILGHLCADRPVSLSMRLKGLSAWGKEAETTHANHAFAVVGFESDADENVTLHTRNSWGGSHPDVPEEDLCRIYGVDSVLTKKDRTRSKP